MNIHDVMRQCLPKGTGLSRHGQEGFEAIAFQRIMRPQKRFKVKCPIEMMSGLMARRHARSANYPMNVLHLEPAFAGHTCETKG